MPKDVPPKITDQNELVLNKVRDDAVNGLLLQGREATFSSKASPTSAGGLAVETTDDKTHKTIKLEITGGDSQTVRPAFSSDFPVGIGASVSNDFTITSNGLPVEKDHIKVTGAVDPSRDDLISPYVGKMDITKTDASGKVIQTAHGDYDKFGHSHFAQNTQEGDWQIKDAKYGNVKMNEVITQQGNGSTEYRSVIRDAGNHILGVVDQIYTTDQAGNLKTVSTEARKSKFQGQVKPPTE